MCMFRPHPVVLLRGDQGTICGAGVEPSWAVCVRQALPTIVPFDLRILF